MKCSRHCGARDKDRERERERDRDRDRRERDIERSKWLIVFKLE
jgi:hypothetical protein